MYPNILCTFTSRHLSITFAIFLVEIYLFLMVCFFLKNFGNFDIVLHVLIFAIRAFWLISGV